MSKEKKQQLQDAINYFSITIRTNFNWDYISWDINKLPSNCKLYNNNLTILKQEELYVSTTYPYVEYYGGEFNEENIVFGNETVKINNTFSIKVENDYCYGYNGAIIGLCSTNQTESHSYDNDNMLITIKGWFFNLQTRQTSYEVNDEARASGIESTISNRINCDDVITIIRDNNSIRFTVNNIPITDTNTNLICNSDEPLQPIIALYKNHSSLTIVNNYK